MAALCALAWVALALWEAGPYGRYLDHGNWTGLGLAASICRVLPGGALVLPAMLYVAGWLLMLTAMMLPTTLPLLDIFHRLTAGRRDRVMLIALVIAGYLVAWLAFGVAAHLLDAALHAVVVAGVLAPAHGWIAGAAVIFIAGAFQFSALKYRCLAQCRSPLGFVIAHWQGRAARVEALRLGLDHGIFCVGCCWAIMLLMFVVGTANVGMMLALGAIMAIEKNMRWGRRLSTPLGAALIGWSGAIVALNLAAAA